MSRPVTLFTGQWADLPLATLAKQVRLWDSNIIEVQRTSVRSSPHHLTLYRLTSKALRIAIDKNNRQLLYTINLTSNNLRRNTQRARGSSVRNECF